MPWSLWKLSPQGAHPLPLPGTGELRTETFVVRTEGNVLEAEALGPALLNDVQLSGRARLQAGDELTSGATRLLVLEHRVGSRAGLLPRREYEPLRQGVFSAAGTVSILLVRIPPVKQRAELLARWLTELPPSAHVSELGPHTLEVLLPEASAELRQASVDRLVASGAERAHGATRRGPRETLDQVLERAFARFLDVKDERQEDATFADPVVLRLLAALERTDGPPADWVLVGERGAGKEALARVAHARADPRGKLVLVREPATPEELTRAAAGEATLFVEWSDGLPASAPWETWRRAARAARRVWWSLPLAPPEAQWVMALPALRDRRRDLLPLAELLLARFGRAAGRSPLSLSASAREALMAAPFPGNVRELSNAMAAAALVSPGAEVTAESLPQAAQHAVGSGRPPENLRSTLNEAEREALLATLARTRWNVTRAAQALGIPRRTVVYRMARLGLRRPARD